MDRKSSLAAGFGALSHGKLVLLLALTTAVLGTSAATPLAPSLSESLAGTLAGDHFIRNHPTFAPTDFFDFLREKADAVRGTRRGSFVATGILGILLQMFFAGGIISVLGRGSFSFGQFFEPARRNLWHNLKCFFIFTVAVSVALGVWLGGGAMARKKLLEDVPPDAAVWSASWWLLAAVGLLLYAILSFLYDFARAARRFAPSIGAWRALRFARKSLSGSWLRALGLWLFWLGVGSASVLGLLAVTWAMPAVSRPAIALLFLLQFGVLWLRSAVRVAAWGSYLAFLEPRARAAIALTVRIRYTVAEPAPAP